LTNHAITGYIPAMRCFSLLRTALVLSLLLPIFHVHVHVDELSEHEQEVCTLCHHGNVDDVVVTGARAEEITEYHYLSDASLIAYVSTSLLQRRARAPPQQQNLLI